MAVGMCWAEATRRFLIAVMRPHLSKLAPPGLEWDDFALILEELEGNDMAVHTTPTGGYEPGLTNEPSEVEYLPRDGT